MEVCDGSRYAGQTPQPRPHPWKLEDDFLGHERCRDWERQDALGQNPRGTVVYTPQRVTFLITKNNRARPEQLPPSDEEKIALFDTMFAYSGGYTVEWIGSCITST